MSFYGKKLLILGGSRYILPVIDYAHKKGVYVITCDYLPDSIAHKYSDEYYNASVVDKEVILKFAEQRKIDGIMSFACDPGVETAAYVAEKLNLPNVGPYESVKILQNKGKFRQFLKYNNFNVPMAKSYTDIEEAMHDANKFNYPVIVKPTDSAGSKGVTRVNSVDELENAIQCALVCSKKKEIIIEDFLEKKGCSSDCDAFSVNGELKFISFSGQLFDEKSANPYVPSAYMFPDTFSVESREELKKDIQRVLKLLNMDSAIYNIETRECVNGKTYIMEISPRGGGNRLAEMVKYTRKIDLIAKAVDVALGEKNIDFAEESIKGYWLEIILHSDKKGLFEKLEISSEIEKNLIEKDLWIKENDKVEIFNGANNAIGTLIFNFETKEDLEKVVKNQNEYIKVKVKD